VGESPRAAAVPTRAVAFPTKNATANMKIEQGPAAVWRVFSALLI
jgi:hypothetical protein